MSVRAPQHPFTVRQGAPLQQAQSVPFSHVEHDVFDSRGNWFGTAVPTPTGARFLRPPEFQGIHVMPPFTVRSVANTDRLAASLGSALSRALLHN